jgi:hypothetical protein
MDETERHAAGMRVRREILGDAYVDRAITDTTDLTARAVSAAGVGGLPGAIRCVHTALLWAVAMLA